MMKLVDEELIKKTRELLKQYIVNPINQRL